MSRETKWMISAGLVLLVFLFAGCVVQPIETSSAHTADSDTPGTPEMQVENPLDVETFCSPTKVRTGAALIALKDSIGAAFADGGQPIEVTVFKQGFENGVFGTLSDTSPGASFQPPDAMDADLQALEPILRLTVGEPSVDAPTFDEESAESVVVVEGLEPGLIYYWRAGPETEPVRVEAPVCVADMHEE